MSEPDIDEQIARVMLGLMKVRRTLDRESFDALIGAVMMEVDLGLQVAEEAALEARYRRKQGENVAWFPNRVRV